jgi:hypothetical protein
MIVIPGGKPGGLMVSASGSTALSISTFAAWQVLPISSLRLTNEGNAFNGRGSDAFISLKLEPRKAVPNSSNGFKFGCPEWFGMSKNREVPFIFYSTKGPQDAYSRGKQMDPQWISMICRKCRFTETYPSTVSMQFRNTERIRYAYNHRRSSADI